MKVIAVTSGKGGTGRSCIAAYTGVALAAGGSKVLLVEPGVRSLDLILGAHDRVVYDILDVLSGKCSLQEAVQHTDMAQGLDLLAGVISPGEDLSPYLANFLAGGAAGGYDYLLLDAPCLERFPPSLVDTVLVVTTPESLCVRACSWQARELFQMGYAGLRLIINNVPAQVLPMLGAEDFDDVIDQIGVQLIAVIPASPKLQYSANNAKPLSGESLIPQVFDNLAARLRGENRPLLIR